MYKDTLSREKTLFRTRKGIYSKHNVSYTVKNSRTKLNESKSRSKKEKSTETVFNVSGILQQRKAAGGKTEFLVSWEGYDVQTWEPSTNIPIFIQDYFLTTGKNDLPVPRIKHTKNVGNAIYHCMVLEGSDLQPQYIPTKNFLVENEERLYAKSRFFHFDVVHDTNHSIDRRGGGSNGGKTRQEGE